VGLHHRLFCCCRGTNPDTLDPKPPPKKYLYPKTDITRILASPRITFRKDPAEFVFPSPRQCSQHCGCTRKENKARKTHKQSLLHFKSKIWFQISRSHQDGGYAINSRIRRYTNPKLWIRGNDEKATAESVPSPGFLSYPPIGQANSANTYEVRR
jgi:hypothetical protein